MKLVVTIWTEVIDETQANNYLAALKQWLHDKQDIKFKADLNIDKSEALSPS